MKALEAVRNAIRHTGGEEEVLLDIHFQQEGVTQFPTARIATDLVPRVNAARGKRKSRILILGNDGPNIAKHDYPWLKDLKNWIQEGCDVSYLLLNPSPAAIKRLKAEFAGCCNAKTGIQIYTIDRANVLPEDAKRLKQWETFHFVVFENPSQLWVEGYHASGKTVALDCAYFSPEAAGKSSLPDVLASQFRYMISAYGRRLALGSEAASVESRLRSEPTRSRRVSPRRPRRVALAA